MSATSPAAGAVAREAARRRTVAVISHPDAGKTTLTEHLLVTGGVRQSAGQVRGKRDTKATVTDWMAMEQERGISVTSAAVRIDTGEHVVNLLDTPGHGDFSDDTYRVLAAVDAAIMLLDAAKGIEPQTRRLFEVCRARRTPLITFINKLDRPARPPLELLDEIENTLGITPCPLTWPAGDAERFRGVVHLPGMERVAAEGASLDAEEWTTAEEEGELAWETVGGFDHEMFLAGDMTPVLWGTALRDVGVDHLLAAIERHAPAPPPRATVDGDRRPLDTPFAAQVFKLQSNMDPRHRDTVAFLRICAGRFERGMRTTCTRTGRPIVITRAQEPFGQERDIVEEAWPGDVIVVPSAATLRVGDTLHDGPAVSFPAVRTFAPEDFRRVSNRDTGRRKQFQKGLEQLGEEGVVRVLVEPGVGVQLPIVAGTGQLQFEVFEHRMRDEYGVEIGMDTLGWRASAQTTEGDADRIRSCHGASVLERLDGAPPLAVFTTRTALESCRRELEDVELDPLVD